MPLIDELKAKKAEILKQMEAIDKEGAKVREQYEEMLASLRQKRIPLEEHLSLVNNLLKAEGGG